MSGDISMFAPVSWNSSLWMIHEDSYSYTLCFSWKSSWSSVYYSSWNFLFNKCGSIPLCFDSFAYRLISLYLNTFGSFFWLFLRLLQLLVELFLPPPPPESLSMRLCLNLLFENTSVSIFFRYFSGLAKTAFVSWAGSNIYMRAWQWWNEFHGFSCSNEDIFTHPKTLVHWITPFSSLLYVHMWVILINACYVKKAPAVDVILSTNFSSTFFLSF